MNKEAMKLALEALEQYTDVVASVNDPNTWITVVDAGKPARKAITALREALAEQSAQQESPRPQAREPLLREIAALSANALDDYKMIQKLMAERQPLTDEQIEACIHHVDEDGIGLFAFARAIEAAHGIKEKNT